MNKNFQVIGQSTPRVDGIDKVTGSAKYTADVLLQGAIWGKLLRSPIPHGKILSIDTTAAKKLQGVHSVLTGKDVGTSLWGRRLRDVPILAYDKVRFTGDPVAAVAAEDEDIAEEALALIDIEYEELPPVFDSIDAMKPNAPVLHPGVNSYVGLPEKLENIDNVFAKNIWAKGNIEVGFSESDIVVENTYTTPMVHQAYLEPHSCLVSASDNGQVNIWASNKAPFDLRRQIGEVLNLPEDKITINHSYIGGDFGGKGSPLNVPICYFLSLHSKRPVKIVMDYMEEFVAGNPRHEMLATIKTGLKTDGTPIAHEARLIFNSGAYGGFKPLVNLLGAQHAGGCYRIPNTHIEAIQVYTNRVPCGHMRGPGDPQAIFAIESHIDTIARKLEVDPLDFRMKHLITDGDDNPIGSKYEKIRAKETLLAAADKAKYHLPRKKHVGKGMAIADRPPGGGETHATITLHVDGTATLETPIFDQGSGSYTFLQQIVSEELGVAIQDIRITVGDTNSVPYDSGVGGSRVARIAGNAAFLATEAVKKEIIDIAEKTLSWPSKDIIISRDSISNRRTGENATVNSVIKKYGSPVTGKAKFRDFERPKITSFMAQIAEVSVDTETGQVSLLSLTTSHDIGRILNPTGHQGQVNGGVMQGIGYALMEDIEVIEGSINTLSFGDFKIPTIKDIPTLNTVLVESDNGVGPYQVKAIGENTPTPVAAAIANAVEDAVGVRINDLPITAEKVYNKLKNLKSS